VKAIEAGNIQEIPQDSIKAENQHHAPKIFKEDCLIDWRKSVRDVCNLIRGLSPYPAAFALFQGKSLKIFKAEMELQKHEFNPGIYLSDGKSYLKFSCPDGFISLKEVQLEGKKRMGIEEFLRGIRLEGN